MTVVLVTAFGSLGCVVRYLMEYALRRQHPTLRPWATALANTLGAGLAGYIVTAVAFTSSHELHTIALTGFCGGLTTFSSALAVPGVLAREHHWKYSAALLIATPLLGVAAYYLGGRFA